MNIWLVQTGESIPLTAGIRKMRTALLAEKLVARGHTVVWWASAFDHFKKEWIRRTTAEFELGPGLKVIALKGVRYRRNVSLARYLDHRLVAKRFKTMAAGSARPDIIVSATPPYDLAYEAVRFGQKIGIPVLVDIRDEWPDLFLTMAPPRFRKILRVLLIHDFRLIRRALSGADALTAMMSSLLEWGLGYAQRPRTPDDAVFYLGQEKMRTVTERPEKLAFLDGFRDAFVVTYVGTFVQNNNPSVLIDCARALVGRKIVFVLAGQGELFPEIRSRAADLPNVFFPGWLGLDEVAYLLGRSHVGVCPTPYDREAFPNKALTYFSAGIPVLSSFHGEIKTVLEQLSLGFYWDLRHPEKLTEKILLLSEDRDLYRQMAERVRDVFPRLFDAEKIYGDFAAHIEGLAKRCRQRNLETAL